MTRTLIVVFALAAFGVAATAADKKVQMKDLPPVVQKAAQDEAKGAEIKGILQETQKGQPVYEIETVRNGKGRDFVLDAKGAVLEVEEEVSFDTFPAAAKAAIEKIVADGKITKTETITKRGKTNYEAAYTKGGKEQEVLVRADGSVVKQQ
jgi:uncharacterized membrane protein YkoI